MISVSDALAPGGLLAPHFAGDSWVTWRAIMRAAEGLPLDDDQRARFWNVAEREPPAHRVRELWAIAGRRGGKDSLASAVATVAALGDYRAGMRPGERAMVMCLATDRDQARIVKRYIAGYFREIPLLQPLAVRETDEGLELNNGVDIVIATNSFRSVRGRTTICAIFDECAFWRSEEFANPDVETYNGVMPGLVTLPNAMLVGISTPYRKGGLLYEKWRNCYGKPDDDVLVVKGPSTAFNPTLPQAIIDAALERDPEAAAAEWLAEWRSDLSDFLDRELISGAVDAGVVVRPPRLGIRYVGFADWSGGRGDSAVVAIAHGEGNVAVLDALYERRAPFDSDAAITDASMLLRSYGLHEVVGDDYGAELTVASFKRAPNNITYKSSTLNRSEIYLNVLPLFTSGRARLLDNPRLVHQFAGLERRTGRSGRDTVDHGRAKGAHDDCANAAAGALTLVVSKAPAVIFTSEMVSRLQNQPGVRQDEELAMMNSLTIGNYRYH